MISKALLLQAVSAYRYAATPPPITADQVISDDFGGAFCGDDGAGCTVRAPGAKTPLVTQLLRNASGVEAYAAQRRPGVRNPVLWVPLGHATSQGAFDGLCAFVTRLVPILAKASDVAGFTLLTLPYPVGEHGSPWDHAYLRKKQYPPCGFDKLARLLDAPKLQAWFVMDHDRHENDAWVLHPKLRHVPMGLTKGFEALGAGLALLRKQHKPRSVDVYANFHVHAAGRTIAGARQSAADVAERNFKSLNRMKTLTRRNATCALRSDGSACTPEEHYVGELLKARYVISPPGSQIDCHRHWEALVFGAVPVVHASPITRALLDGLPACFVPAWDALTTDVLKRCDARLAKAESFDWDRLTVDYWRTQISESKAGQRESKPPAKGDAVEAAARWAKDRDALIEMRKAGRWAALLQNYSRVQKLERSKAAGKYIVAFARVHGHASRIATITSTLALAMASGRALAVVWPRRTNCRGRDHILDKLCDPAGVTDLLQPHLVDFSMPPSVQKQLLAKGGCGHVQDLRRGPEEQWVVRDTRDQKMLLDIYRGGIRETPPVVCTAGKDDWSWAATCKLGGVSPLSDAGALQDFLFKPSAAVLKRVGAIIASSPQRPCDLGIHLIAADRTSEWGTKKGDESWLRTVAEAIAAQEDMDGSGKQLDFAIFVAADHGSTRTKSLLQEAFGDAVVFMDGHGVSPDRTTVEANVEALAENYVLSTCAEILPADRNSAFRSIAAARAAFEQGWTANRSRAFVEGGKHVASGAPAACADLS
jgi:hypothetical protein